jgi:exosortase/archaeosortase family protein
MKKNVLILGLEALAFWDVWQWYALRLTSGSEEDRWGLLAIGAGIYFLWRERRISITTNLMIPAGFILTYAATFHFLSPIFRAGIAIVTLAITLSILLHGKWLNAANTGLFLLSLPVIPSLQFYLGYPLRVVVGAVTAPLLQLSGLAVQREGTCLVWNATTISIDAPCSGVKMLWAGYFLVFVLAEFFRLNFVRTLMLALVTLPVLILGNIFRATALFYLEAHIVTLPDYLNPDSTHAYIGIVAFSLTALGILYVAQFIQHFSPKKSYAKRQTIYLRLSYSRRNSVAQDQRRS